MRLRRIGLITFVLLLIALPVWAKGPSDRIVLTGPTLQGEMILTDPGIVRLLSMARLEDFGVGKIEAPAEPGEVYYQLDRQFETPRGEYQTFDRVQYYPGAGEQPGYVYYLGMENGWSEYDQRWFHARPQAAAVFETIFDVDAQPYLVLMQASGQVHFVDPATLDEVAALHVFDYPMPMSTLVDGPDTQTMYFDTHQAGFDQHYRLNLQDKAICSVDVLPPSAGEASGALWVAGLMAEEVARREQLTGTWLEPVDSFGDGLVLLHHPLGRYHHYDYGAEDRGEIPGGILVYSQNSRQRVDQWQPELGFAQVMSGDRRLYALRAPRQSERVELYVLDGRSGEILRSRTLDAGDWTLGYATLDLTGVDSEIDLRFVDRCQFDPWELPEMLPFASRMLAFGS